MFLNDFEYNIKFSADFPFFIRLGRAEIILSRFKYAFACLLCFFFYIYSLTPRDTDRKNHMQKQIDAFNRASFLFLFG